MTARERILNSALELFSSLGYEKTTTRLIAQHAEVNEVTIFRNFETKQILLEQVTLTYVTGMSLNPELEQILSEKFNETLKDFSSFVMNKYYDNEMMFNIQIKIDIEGFEKLNLSKFFVDKLSQYLKKNNVDEHETRAKYFISQHLGFLTTYVCKLYDKEQIEIQRTQFVGDFIEVVK